MIQSYKELTIKKYLELRKLTSEGYDDELQLQCSLIAVLADMSEDEVLSLSLPEYQNMVKATSFLLDKPVLNKHIPNKVVINGVKYNITKDVSKLNVAQYIDYQTLSAEHKEEYIPNTIACFMVPEGNTYGDGKYDIDKVVSDISEHMSIQDAISIAFFFSKKYQTIIEDMLIYLAWRIRIMNKRKMTTETKKKLKEAQTQMILLRDFLKNGDGSHLFTM